MKWRSELVISTTRTVIHALYDFSLFILTYQLFRSDVYVNIFDMCRKSVCYDHETCFHKIGCRYTYKQSLTWHLYVYLEV